MTDIVLTGGDKLEARLKEILEKVSKAGVLRVGFLEGATYQDGTSVPMVAAIQEYGAPAAGIPPRPYFRTMIADKRDGWAPALGLNLVAQDYDANKALAAVGEGIKGQLQESITKIVAPALSPITVMLRDMRSRDQGLIVTGKTVGQAAALVAAGASNHGASDKPLIDSGHLLNSVDYEVKS